MKRVVGIVSEGPTDYLVLKEVIDKISGESNSYLRLQPEPDLKGRYGNGWKGVWRWCYETPSARMLMEERTPQIDLLVIQIDGDVFRKEREVHCSCDSAVCDCKEDVFPLYCDKVPDSCPVVLPCRSHNDCIADTVVFGTDLLMNTLNKPIEEKTVVAVSCDSIDTWVVAAFDGIDDVETKPDPWKTIISKNKFYHGVRVRGDKKNAVVYSAFSKKVGEQWDEVISQCESAQIFDRKIRKVLSLNRPL